MVELVGHQDEKAGMGHFFDFTQADFREWVVDLGLPKFRANQIIKWVYERGVTDLDQMTDLSRNDQALLRQKLYFTDGVVVRHEQATDGTQKLLIDWKAAEHEAGEGLPQLGVYPDYSTECVMIPAVSKGSGNERKTACISSQVGCAVGCKFCASGIGGLDGNLTAGQIVQQVWQLGRMPDVGRISNVVFMGMGEPLSNFAQVTKAIGILTAEWGLNISARKITVSTVGLPAQIKRLAEKELPPITLAISLHAPNDVLRRELIPWAQYTSIEAIVDAGKHYFEKTGREITLEYILLGGVNDQPEHAAELASLTRQMRCNVNLIRYNEVAGLPYRRPADRDVLMFQHALRKHRVNVHIRASRGRDISAACGQLRHEKSQ